MIRFYTKVTQLSPNSPYGWRQAIGTGCLAKNSQTSTRHAGVPHKYQGRGLLVMHTFFCGEQVLMNACNMYGKGGVGEWQACPTDLFLYLLFKSCVVS